MLDPLFRWVPPSPSICYLGCHVGLELSAEQQIAPLLEYQKEAGVLEYGPPLSSPAGCGGQPGVVGHDVVYHILLDLLEVLHQSGAALDQELLVVWW